ncbi:urease accessory protein UreE [Riemerella columbina]|uniref:urease accessory protein UreE n=1 Tax=Riemerella columbina TaxID=103810 RepID=UPI00037E2751|nr:urease accessory protein UreE [Riemerella columbina]
MIINEAIGNVAHTDIQSREIDYLDLQWFETPKRIQRKKTRSGKDIAIKFLKEGQRLYEGDILYMDDQTAVVINVLPTDAIVLTPKSMLEMGTVCYEIGNKHMPLFIQNDQVLMPFEHPMFRWLEASGYQPRKETVKLLNLLKSNVEPHQHGNSNSGTSLFTKILHLASSK